MLLVSIFFNFTIFVPYNYYTKLVNKFSFYYKFTADSRISNAVQWDAVSKEDWNLGVRINLTHFKEIKQVTKYIHLAFQIVNFSRIK